MFKCVIDGDLLDGYNGAAMHRLHWGRVRSPAKVRNLAYVSAVDMLLNSDCDSVHHLAHHAAIQGIDS